MKLTPLDIKKQEFKRTFRGYDGIEVDAFLEMVSDELEELIREKKDLSDEVLTLRTQLRDYQNVEKTLQDTLVHAQESIKDSKESSSREASMLIREAELSAERILADAKLKLAEMKNELVVIKAQKDSFARRLRHLLDSQLDLIEVLAMDDVGFDRYDPKIPRRKPPEPKAHNTQADQRTVSGPERPAQRPASQEEEPEQPHGIQWGERNVEADAETEPKQEQDRSSRISDQLII